LVHTVSQSLEDLLVTLACQFAGLVEVPIDAAGGDAYVRTCRQRGGGCWLGDEDKRRFVRQAFHAILTGDDPGGGSDSIGSIGDDRVDPSADALVLWTSGTSGEPKGVVHSHTSLLRNAEAKLAAVPQSPDDLRLTLLSIAHAYARTCDLGTWLLSGCRLAIARGFDGWSELAGPLQPTLCNMVPSLAERVLAGGAVPSSLRLLGCGGAALSAASFERWRRRGVTVIQGYGLTEAGPVICSQTPEDSQPERVGRLVRGWESRLDAAGRLFVRGPHLMDRYLDAPALTEARLDAAGWLDTGDMVRRCGETGQLRILGRADERIVLANGYTVDPAWIERRVQTLAGVRTAVVTVASHRRGVELWLEIASRPPSTEQLETAFAPLAAWERPLRVRHFTVPGDRRAELFNRKGAVRRRPMLRFLDGFRPSP
jgi:long-chain acyl-CoA synthetase